MEEDDNGTVVFEKQGAYTHLHKKRNRNKS
jgi:hypothetical protein